MKNVGTTSGNYPLMSQSEWDNAPFNKEKQSPQKVDVTVSITLSKTVQVEVDDYTTEEVWDEDYHGIDYDFSECDLKQAVKNQIYLPNEAFRCIDYRNWAKAKNDLKDWCVDDFEVVLE